MSASQGARYRRSDQVVFRRIGDECLLVPIRDRPEQGLSVFSLNRLGAFLWGVLDEPRALDELVARTTAAFHVDADRAGTDLGRFLDQLVARRLVEVTAP